MIHAEGRDDDAGGMTRDGRNLQTELTAACARLTASECESLPPLLLLLRCSSSLAPLVRRTDCSICIGRTLLSCVSLCLSLLLLLPLLLPLLRADLFLGRLLPSSPPRASGERQEAGADEPRDEGREREHERSQLRSWSSERSKRRPNYGLMMSCWAAALCLGISCRSEPDAPATRRPLESRATDGES